MEQITENKIRAEITKLLREYSTDKEDTLPDVEKAVDAIKNVMGGDHFFDRINTPIEKAEVISQFADKIGVPRSEYWDILGKIRSKANESEEKNTIDYNPEDFKKFKKDVERFMDRIMNDPTVDQTISLLNRRKEKGQLIKRFIDMIGVPKHKMYDLMSYIAKIDNREK